MTDSSSHNRHFFATLLIAAFGLNWLWEMLQMPAYVELKGRSWQETALLCTLASVGDAMLAVLIYGAGALVTGRVRWGMSGGWKTYTVVALLGLTVAVFIEWLSRGTGWWSYNNRMPVVFGFGLWPLLQQLLLVPASLRIAVWWYESKRQAI
jgi:hypothetical protein